MEVEASLRKVLGRGSLASTDLPGILRQTTLEAGAFLVNEQMQVEGERAKCLAGGTSQKHLKATSPTLGASQRMAEPQWPAGCVASFPCSFGTVLDCCLSDFLLRMSRCAFVVFLRSAGRKQSSYGVNDVISN